METMLADLTPSRAALLYAVPLIFTLAAVPAFSPGASRSAWRWARLGAALALATSIVSVAWLLVAGPGLWRGPDLFSAADSVRMYISLRSPRRMR